MVQEFKGLCRNFAYDIRVFASTRSIFQSPAGKFPFGWKPFRRRCEFEKDFHLERRVEHLVPNQIPVLVETC
jgi:hypothetical protein